MAEEIHVSGPLTVKWGDTPEILGRTDGDGARLVAEQGADPVFTSEYGNHVPTDFVYTGQFAKVTMTMPKFNREVLEKILSITRGGTALGDLGSLGLLLKGTGEPLSLEKTAGATGPTYDFPVSLVANDGVEFSRIGVSAELCQITFTALPATNAADSPVWAET